MSACNPIFRDIIDPNSAKNRQEIIKRIQKSLGGKLITYISNPGHPFSGIMKLDVLPFEDMLRSVGESEKNFLMINCPGGDSNAAEKLLLMCRQRFTKEFDIIVPDYAKSAATMLALGSDKILMGYLAELGPIDPQLSTGLPPFQVEMIPARSFIDGLEIIRDKIKKGDPPAMYLSMLGRIRPEVLGVCQRAIEDSRMFAEKWLKKCMLKGDPKQAELVAKLLSEGEEYKSHGKVINFEDAKNVLKLDVEKIDEKSDLWNDIWELYCRSVHFLMQGGGAKLFESDSVSLTLDIGVKGPPPTPTQAPPKPPQKMVGKTGNCESPASSAPS